MTPIRITVQALSYAVETAEAIEQAANGLGKMLVCRVEFEEGFYLTWNREARIWEVEIPTTARELLPMPGPTPHGDDMCRAKNPHSSELCWYGHHLEHPDQHSWSPGAADLEKLQRERQS